MDWILNPNVKNRSCTCVNTPSGPQLQMFEEEERGFARAYGTRGGPVNDRLVLI